MKKSGAVAMLVACVTAGASLFVIATRPCEPKAHAATEPKMAHEAPKADNQPVIVQVGEITVAVQAPRRGVAHIARKSGGECGAKTPGVRTSQEELVAGSGGTVTFYDCR